MRYGFLLLFILLCTITYQKCSSKKTPKPTPVQCTFTVSPPELVIQPTGPYPPLGFFWSANTTVCRLGIKSTPSWITITGSGASDSACVPTTVPNQPPVCHSEGHFDYVPDSNPYPTPRDGYIVFTDSTPALHVSQFAKPTPSPTP